MEIDVLIVGAGPTGLACAIEAQQKGLRAVVIEKGCLVNSIFHYPANMVFFTTSELLEIGGIPFPCAQAKPSRLEALEYYRKVTAHFQLDVRQYERVESITPRTPGTPGFRVISDRARYEAEAVVIATGYYDLPNLMGVPGEELPHVYHYFHEAHAFAGLRVAVIGGKNFAVETALDLFRHGAKVTLIHRRAELAKSIKYWVRPDIDNRLKAGEIAARFSTHVREIQPGKLRLHGPDGESEMPADFVFALTGYHPDFQFLRDAGVTLDDAERPVCDPATYETNVPGLYLGGVVVAGRNTSEIFIENGRFHGQVIVASILAQRGAAIAR
ncbi:MAG: YpdA family putative bacillithiol disulfide reductase [Acidobacteria bacterium]|nr:MAG: YpdA family putative bacillithiol disulfide reductase [Acidobacteriota bacterium]